MIVPTPTFDAFKYAALGGFVLAIGAALVFVPKNLDPKSDRAKTIQKRALAVVALLILLAVAGFGIEPFGTPVVIVKIAPASEMTKTRGRLYGSATYALQDGHSVTLAGQGKTKTIVVNDSKSPMHVEMQSYGDESAAFMSHLVADEDKIEPWTMATFDHAIDFIGADDPPPPKVQGVYAENRYWLKW